MYFWSTVFLVSFFLTWMGAKLSYAYIEKPFMKLGRDLVQRLERKTPIKS